MTESGAQIVSWQSCVIDEIVQQTPNIKSFFFRLAKPFGHIAGQHVDVRLTAPDGYRAMRSYSIASSANSSATIELAIERLPDGEVSQFFHDAAAVGDEIELRGPLGGHFLWPEHATDPVLLIGAGSGLVPLMAMIRQRRALAQTVPTALLLSARTAEDVLFSEELHSIALSDPAFALALAITREKPIRTSDYSRRMGSTPKSRTVVKGLKTSIPALQLFAASLGCGTALCIQTHRLWRHRALGISCGRRARA